MKTRIRKPAIIKWDYPPGTPVLLTKDDGTKIETRTASKPWMLGGHSQVIMLEGISGCYSLDRVSSLDASNKGGGE